MQLRSADEGATVFYKVSRGFFSLFLAWYRDCRCAGCACGAVLAENQGQNRNIEADHYFFNYYVRLVSELWGPNSTEQLDWVCFPMPPPGIIFAYSSSPGESLSVTINLLPCLYLVPDTHLCTPGHDYNLSRNSFFPRRL
jgi:hypothetical protein